MDADKPTADELEFARNMCRAAEKTGMNWPLAVTLFPAQTEEEERWKQRTLKAIRSVCESMPRSFALL